MLQRDARKLEAGVSQAGAWTGLQLPGRGDTQGFDSSSPANIGDHTKLHTWGWPAWAIATTKTWEPLPAGRAAGAVVATLSPR